MRIVSIPGDGIGPEVTAQSIHVLESLRRFDFEFEIVDSPAGARALETLGEPLPASTLREALNADAVLFGAVGDARYDHLDRGQRPEQAIFGLREGLGLYASLRHIRIDPLLAHLSPLKPSLTSNVDLMIIREMSGDVYMGSPSGQRLAPDGIGQGQPEGFDTMRYSRPEVQRIAHSAFEVAKNRGGRLLSVDKANVLETSKMWRKVVSDVARDYVDVQLSHMYADTAGMMLVANPSKFDVVLAPNLFGDLLSDIASMLTGSVALAASAMFGDSGQYLFEPGHGTALDIAGRDVANPISSIRATSLLLRYAAKRPDLAIRVENAIQSVLREGLRTADIHSPDTTLVGTDRMGSAIAREIERGALVA